MRKGYKKWLMAAVAVTAVLSQLGVLPPTLGPLAELLADQLDAPALGV